MSYQMILAALDFSEGGGLAVRRARELARHYQAELHVLHIVEFIPPVDTSFGTLSPFEVDLTDQMVDASKTRLAELAKSLDLPEDRCLVVVGSPKQEIIRVAEDLGADLIVVGTHGRHGLGLLLGSTASSVVNHSKCDVLTVRLEGE
jgi:universal stress protein A